MGTTWQLPWLEPISAAACIKHDHLALLYSGAAYDYTGRYSFLCVGAEEVISGYDIRKLEGMQQKKSAWFENFWVGWLGYGLKNQLEQLPEDARAFINTEDFYFFKPETILRFDHQKQLVEGYGKPVQYHCERSEAICLKSQHEETWIAPVLPRYGSSDVSLLSNMTTEQYKSHAAEIISDIKKGNYYQANLTRKYFGEFAQEVSGLTLFSHLTQVSPAAYSAYFKTPDVEVISSSPEQFLHIATDGSMHSRPIKGSMKRSNNASEDEAHKAELEQSVKNRAENLMIVDLMRHDFSRVCEQGSVGVDKLFEVTTHPLIHHLSSAIHGHLKPGVSPMQATLACFPPGSMTGAPKIRAMQKLSALEKQRRGIYSGAIGWFGGDGSAELSVVIRTLIKQGNKFEFQVGGGIVADSTPEGELQEMLTKALGICKVLGIEAEQLL